MTAESVQELLVLPLIGDVATGVNAIRCKSFLNTKNPTLYKIGFYLSLKKVPLPEFCISNI